MSKKGRQNKVSQEVANPTVSKAEAEFAKDSVDTGKQAKKKPLITIKPGRTEKALLSTAFRQPQLFEQQPEQSPRRLAM
ncbi:hypothetical protein ACWNXI_05525 [Caldibacillus thermoamylovorans]